MKANSRIVVSLAGMVLFVMVGVTVLLRAYTQIEQAGESREQTNLELIAAANFQSALKDAETGYRGYLLTREEAFLEPYARVRDALVPDLEAMRRYALDSAARAHLDTVVPIMATILANMREGIELRKGGNLPQAAMEVRIGQGKQRMDRIRLELEAFTRIEREALVRRDAQFQVRLRAMLAIIWATSGLTLALAFLFAFLFYREAQRRIKGLVLQETRQMLERQTELNQELQRVNTTLQASEEKLHWSEESFHLMVESVVDCAIVMLDPAGRILTWNNGAERIKGFTSEEAIGSHFSMFYPPEGIGRGEPERVLETAAGGRCECHGWRIRKDGSVFWANVILTAIRDGSGTLRGFAKLTMDLTERKKVEAEIQDARLVAEKASLAKSEFLSSMSHELRTPLNAILGFAQLMDTDSPPPGPSQKRSLAQILKAGWHLLTLINEILDLSKVESGQMPISMEPVALGEVVAECRGMMEGQAAARGLTLIFPPPDLPGFVLGDRTRVKQVLLNLLSNAVKYNTPQGTIEVHCFRPRPGSLRLAIRDQGPGLLPEQLAQLFQPFNRLGQGAGEEEGSGIGLVLAKRLVELMGGVIGVESRPGAGSEFWFDLQEVSGPRQALEGRLAFPPAEPADPGLPVVDVLYVEDNPANLALVEQLLARYPGLRLLTAVDGPAGLALARMALPAAVLMDINLPGMSGYEALERLRAEPATSRIPVIAISANAMASDRERGLQAGFADYITKPIEVAGLLDSLQGVLGSRVNLSARQARP